MSNIKIIIFFCFAFVANQGFAQKSKSAKPKDPYNRAYNLDVGTPFRIAAIGTPLNPGFKIGLDFALRNIERRSFRGDINGLRMIQDRYITTDLGAYHHKKAFENLFFNIEYASRRTNGHGYFWQWSAGAGVNYTLKSLLMPIAIAEMDTLSLPKVNQWYGTPIVGFSIGRDFAHKRYNKVPMSIYLRGSGNYMIPVTGNFKASYFYPTAEFGLQFMLNGWSHSIRSVLRS
ncbi:MAG: hypothetical protein RIS64_1846 [Bacteroidota bacterium]|jgi:hypothetical protein